MRILRMAEALGAAGHDVHVITYHLGSPDIPVSVPVHRIRDLKFYRKLSPGPSYSKLAFVDPFLVAKLRERMKATPFDVIHAHHYEGVMVAAAARIGHRVPVVYDAHTLLMSELPYYSLGLPYGVKRSMGRWMDGAIPKLATHTVCVTQTIRDKLVNEAGLKAARVSVISNGVEFDHFAAATRGTLPSAGGRTLIFTGNLAEYQGIDLMLRAFRLVLNRVPDARLLIASDSSFAPYEALAQELAIRAQIDVIPSPPFRDLPALLATGTVALNPRTDGDGIPVKLLNYMAAARPIVSFTGSAPGVVHGESGWLIPGADVAAFADGVVKLLEDAALAHRLGQGAQRYVEENCQWQIVARRCEALYRTLIPGQA
ncbi:MAG: glycosyltransferase family 4 protein [Gammaproteobacteria bacterium]